ncbi:Arm DNA-binding domain-containing protein [Bradyrhizobium sp. CW9]|uniref:Arm DNA-binding domain-containing protein n=1 Tax=Bradyrhizobium sp. CW9 TaxID=2782689 RepID=UPI003211F70C
MAGRLKPLDVERQNKPGKYADGEGLYLIVTGPTSKSWSYRYWKDGKERWHGLGLRTCRSRMRGSPVMRRGCA